MEVGDAETEAGAGLEATGGRVHADGGRGEGVVWREHERSPVLAAVVRRVGRAGQDVVPLKDIPLGRMRDNVRWRRLGDGCVFSCESLGCCGRRHGVCMCVCVRAVREERQEGGETIVGCEHCEMRRTLGGSPLVWARAKTRVRGRRHRAVCDLVSVKDIYSAYSPVKQET